MTKIKLNFENLVKLYKEFVTTYVESHDVSCYLHGIIKGFLEENVKFFKENNMDFKSGKDLSEFLKAHIESALAPAIHKSLIEYSKNIQSEDKLH